MMWFVFLVTTYLLLLFIAIAFIHWLIRE